jgi:cysteinyl-tRNA synthetase
MFSKYREEGISAPVPAEEQNLVNRHHKAFLDNMSDDLKTTDVLDGVDGFADLLKTINSNLNDLKVCWYCFLCYQVLRIEFLGIVSDSILFFGFCG